MTTYSENFGYMKFGKRHFIQVQVNTKYRERRGIVWNRHYLEVRTVKWPKTRGMRD